VLLLRSCSPRSASAAPELAIRTTALDGGSTIRGIPRVAARRLAALWLRAQGQVGAASALEPTKITHPESECARPQTLATHTRPWAARRASAACLGPRG
jgi:hypothetical protein